MFYPSCSIVRMTQEASVLIKACVVKQKRTKVVPRVIYPVLGNRDGIFCALKSYVPTKIGKEV